MKARLLYWGFIWMATATIFSSCDDDEKTKTIPEVTTFEATDVTATSATGGGEITSDGNDEIAASGLAYSSTNALPTIADSKTEEGVTDGEFISELTGLTSGTTYHVRAYATNSKGTGYGAVVNFSTGNLAPVAMNVAIAGTVELDMEVSADYDYDDAEDDAENQTESGTSFQWYIADDIAGSGETAITGATSRNYTIDTKSYEFKYLRVGVTPKSSVGTTTGVEMKSALSQVAVSTTKVHFTYNGQEVAYGIIISSITGRQWLDRNLGAQRAATSFQDYLAYGDLFQWGRPDDGHQLISWTDKFNGAAVNGTTTTKFTTDVPGSSLFYIDPTNTSPVDWRNPQNSNLWQVPDQINNPCPSGWHIPSNAEWDAEIAGAGSELVIDVLKLAASSFRIYNSGNVPICTEGESCDGAGSRGYYWSSTPFDHPTNGRKYGYVYDARKSLSSGSITDLTFRADEARAAGFACKCIKNE